MAVNNSGIVFFWCVVSFLELCFLVDAPSLKLSRSVKYKVDTCGAVAYFNSMETKHTTEASAVQDARKETETLARVSSVEYFSSYSFGDSRQTIRGDWNHNERSDARSYASKWGVSKGGK